jgi:hypothetical protein
MSYDPNLPGGGPEVTPLHLFGLNPNRTPEQVAAAKAIADSEAEEARKREEVRMAADAASRTAEQHAAEEAAKADAFAHGHSAYQSPVTGEAAFLEPDYRPATASELAGRVAPAQDTSAAARVVAYQPPAPKGEWVSTKPNESVRKFQDTLGNMVSYANKLGEDRKDSGVLRWSMGGMWYERQPGSSVDTPVAQVTGPMGVSFKSISGAPADMDTIHSIARGSRDVDLVGPPTEDQQYGAFGRALPAATGGGFSPSPALSDVATLPQSSIDEIMQQLQLSRAKSAIAGEQPASTTHLPEHTGVPAVDITSLIAKMYPWMSRNQLLDITREALSRGVGQKQGQQETIEQLVRTRDAADAELADVDAKLADKKLDPATRQKLQQRHDHAVNLKTSAEAVLVPQYAGRSSSFNQ